MLFSKDVVIHKILEYDGLSQLDNGVLSLILPIYIYVCVCVCVCVCEIIPSALI